MDRETKVSVSKQVEGIVHNIAALMYYDTTGKLTPQFEQLTPEEATPFLKDAAHVLVILDKLNLEAMPKIDIKAKEEKDHKNVEILENIIKDFVKTLKHPKNVASVFPCKELAAKIWDYNGKNR